jgi:uncharacterized ion transporter superfamily protein YfcC
MSDESRVLKPVSLSLTHLLAALSVRAKVDSCVMVAPRVIYISTQIGCHAEMEIRFAILLMYVAPVASSRFD